MNTSEKFPEKKDLHQEELLMKFKEYFPQGDIREITQENIPDFVRELFERKSQQFVDIKDYRPRNFQRFFLITHSDNSKTYVAQQTKTYNTNKNTEILSYFVDSSDEEVLGYSELRFNISNRSEYFQDKPFVGYTNTEQKYRKKGLGTRRLLMMNAFSKALYSLPLYSDTLVSGDAKPVWEKLVDQGKAKKLKKEKMIGMFSLTRSKTLNNCARDPSFMVE